jgi:hypothetical protein
MQNLFLWHNISNFIPRTESIVLASALLREDLAQFQKKKNYKLRSIKIASTLLMITYSNHNTVLNWITDIAYYIAMKVYLTLESHGSV